jgi:hypothetical protein
MRWLSHEQGTSPNRNPATEIDQTELTEAQLRELKKRMGELNEEKKWNKKYSHPTTTSFSPLIIVFLHRVRNALRFGTVLVIVKLQSEGVHEVHRVAIRLFNPDQGFLIKEIVGHMSLQFSLAIIIAFVLLVLGHVFVSSSDPSVP